MSIEEFSKKENKDENLEADKEQKSIETHLEQLKRENKNLKEERDKLKVEGDYKDELIKELEERTVRDPLTKLYNGAYFMPRLQEHLNVLEKPLEKRREQEPKSERLSVLFCDIDNFKQVNDNYGHNVGDEVLIKASEILKENTRGSDIVARIGGEEIALCLPSASKEEAVDKAKDLQNKIKDMTFENNPDLEVTLSIGVVEVDSAENNSEILNNADKAMYAAKETGKDRVVEYTEYQKMLEEGKIKLKDKEE